MIVKSTIDMAHDLGLCVVAEGVENVQLLASLVSQGCDLGQGHGISPPLAADEVSASVTVQAQATAS